MVQDEVAFVGSDPRAPSPRCAGRDEENRPESGKVSRQMKFDFTALGCEKGKSYITIYIGLFIALRKRYFTELGCAMCTVRSLLEA